MKFLLSIVIHCGSVSTKEQVLIHSETLEQASIVSHIVLSTYYSTETVHPDSDLKYKFDDIEYYMESLKEITEFELELLRKFIDIPDSNHM